jgi:methionyl-tRNA synthetase
VSQKWGIPVPIDKKQAIYVWFDALINYLTGVGYGKDEKKFAKWWPADLHLVGKDIIKFHCALWPAMLMSVGLPLPKKVFAHGFFTVAGQKMSKSLGNAMDPLIISKKYGIDALRYFLIHEIKFGEDGDFSINRLEEVYNSELANELGNLVNRVLAMTERYFGGLVPRTTELRKLRNYENSVKNYEKAMEELRPHDAVELILSLVRSGNQMVDREKPWELFKQASLRQAQAIPVVSQVELLPERSESEVEGSKKRLSLVIYCLLDSLRILGWMLYPLMPDTAEKIWEQLGIAEEEKKKKWEKGSVFGGLKPGTKIKKGETLFPKLN